MKKTEIKRLRDRQKRQIERQTMRETKSQIEKKRERKTKRKTGILYTYMVTAKKIDFIRKEAQIK